MPVWTQDTRDLYKPIQNVLSVSEIACDVRTFARDKIQYYVKQIVHSIFEYMNQRVRKGALYLLVSDA